MAAHRTGVGRVINLSSGRSVWRGRRRDSTARRRVAVRARLALCHHQIASEKVAARLAELWQSNIITVRLSGVFGPWSGKRASATRRAPRCRSLRPCSGEKRRLSRSGVGTGFMRLTSPTPCRCSLRQQNPGMAFTTSRPGVSGRRCNGDRILLPSMPVGSAGWRSSAKRRRSICLATPTARLVGSAHGA